MDHILGPRINPDVYARAAAIVEVAKDWRYYENAIINHEQAGAKLYLEYQEGGTWKAHYKSWEDACVPLGKSRRQIDRLIKQEREIRDRTSCPDTAQDETLAKLSVRPDPNSPDFNPMADIEARMPEHIKGKATPKSEPLENGESEEDYEKPRVVTHEVPEEPKDMDGTVIPKKLLSVWNRRDEVQSAMTLASKLRTLIKDLAGQSSEKGGKTDPLYSGMGWQAAITALNSIYYQFSECRPDVVCPLCQGSLKDPRFDNDRECPNCRHLGFVSERRRTEWVNGAKGRKASEAFVERKK